MRTVKLDPITNRQKSFYGKAKVHYYDNGIIGLQSYDTVVCTIKDGKLRRHWGGYSVTTMNHINEFVSQHNIDGKGKAWWKSLPVESMKNTVNEKTIQTMSEIMGDMVECGIPNESIPPMLIVSNNLKVYGAYNAFHINTLREIADTYDSNLVIIPYGKENIKVTCYGKTKTWTSRKAAMDFYWEGIMCSDGCEQSRYVKIYDDLKRGIIL